MKKVLLLASLVLGLSACSIISAPVKGVTEGIGFTVTDYAKTGDGSFEVAAGTKTVRNVAVLLTAEAGKTLTLDKAPIGAVCASANEGNGLYCRLGDFAPFVVSSGTFKGKVSTARLGYLNAEGEAVTVSATILHKP